MLQVYAQYDNHQEAFIIGDLESLMKLRNSLNEIIWGLKQDTATMQECSDGECYSLIISRKSKEELHEKSVKLPYTVAWRNEGDVGNSPHILIENLPEYKSLLQGEDNDTKIL